MCWISTIVKYVHSCFNWSFIPTSNGLNNNDSGSEKEDNIIDSGIINSKE